MQWDHGASATPNAQLTFFAEFLATTGVYDSWVNGCPLSYSSPNAHSKRDVLGTWLLAILAGHNRYAHITGLRGDAVTAVFRLMNGARVERSMAKSFARGMQTNKLGGATVEGSMAFRSMFSGAKPDVLRIFLHRKGNRRILSNAIWREK